MTDIDKPSKDLLEECNVKLGRVYDTVQIFQPCYGIGNTCDNHSLIEQIRFETLFTYQKQFGVTCNDWNDMLGDLIVRFDKCNYDVFFLMVGIISVSPNQNAINWVCDWMCNFALGKNKQIVPLKCDKPRIYRLLQSLNALLPELVKDERFVEVYQDGLRKIVDHYDTYVTTRNGLVMPFVTFNIKPPKYSEKELKVSSQFDKILCEQSADTPFARKVLHQSSNMRKSVQQAMFHYLHDDRCTPETMSEKQPALKFISLVGDTTFKYSKLKNPSDENQLSKLFSLLDKNPNIRITGSVFSTHCLKAISVSLETVEVVDGDTNKTKKFKRSEQECDAIRWQNGTRMFTGLFKLMSEYPFEYQDTTLFLRNTKGLRAKPEAFLVDIFIDTLRDWQLQHQMSPLLRQFLKDVADNLNTTLIGQHCLEEYREAYNIAHSCVTYLINEPKQSAKKKLRV